MSDELLEILRKGDIQKLILFVENNGKVHGRDSMGQTALHRAVMWGHLDLVQYLLKIGAKLEDKALFGFTPLHMAAMNGHLPIVKYLIENGASPETRNKDGFNAYMLAKRHQHSPTVLWMTEKGMNKEYTYKEHYEMSYKQKMDENVWSDDYQLKNDNDISEEIQAFHYTDKEAFEVFCIALEDENIRLVKFLLNYYPKIHLNELNISISSKNPNLVSLLLKKGAYIDIKVKTERDIHQQDSNTKLPNTINQLLFSAKELFNIAKDSTWNSSNDRLKTALVVLGNNINGRERLSGDTALHVAIKLKRIDLVTALLEQDPDVLIQNHSGESVLTLIQKTYSNIPYLLNLTYYLVLKQIKEIIPFNESKFTLKKPEIKKMNQENKSTEIKEVKELKMVKEIKEYTETQDDTMNSEYQEALPILKKYLEAIELYLDEMKNFKKRSQLGYIVGRIISQCPSFFSPARAYHFLTKVEEQWLEGDSKSFSKIHAIMFKLLMDKVIFVMTENNSKPRPIDVLIDGEGERVNAEGEKIEETLCAKEHRLFCMIKHILCSESVHDEVLGKYISDFIFESDSLIGLKGVQNKSVESRIALIQAFKQEIKLTKEKEELLKAKRLREKILEDELRKMELEMKNLEQTLQNEGALEPVVSPLISGNGSTHGAP